MKKIMISLVLLLALVVPASGTDYFYLLDGDRHVVKNSVCDGNINIVIVDCQDETNPDPIGCIIAANLEKEKKVAILKKMATLKK